MAKNAGWKSGWRSLRSALGGAALPYLWVPEWHKSGHGLHAHFARRSIRVAILIDVLLGQLIDKMVGAFFGAALLTSLAPPPPALALTMAGNPTAAAMAATTARSS